MELNNYTGVYIKEVKGKKLLKQFIGFPKHLYNNCPYWVPAIRKFETDLLDPRSNRASAFCTSKLYLAYKNGVLCGRIAGIINSRANELEGRNTLRFGWLDTIDDQQVLNSLIEAVSQWGINNGCTCIKGPLGFTEMDRFGVLTGGFDRISSFNCSYNYPYYDTLLARAGFSKETDWIQRQVDISEELPPVFKHTKSISSHYGIHIAQTTSISQTVRKYGMDIFDVYNKSFSHLYAFAPISKSQAHNYIRIFAPLLDSHYISICVNSEDKPVGFIICVPSLSKAIRASSGRLFPDGIIRIIKTLKTRKAKTAEALIMAVLPEYWGSGAILLMLENLHKKFLKRGIRTMILNPQQEKNHDAISLFNHFKTSMHSRRRAYVKSLQ